MKDYRLATYSAVLARYEEEKRENGFPDGHIDTWTNEGAIARGRAYKPLHGYARDDLPADRLGVIAVVHPLLMRTDEQSTAWNETAKEIALETAQHVYTIMTMGRWHMMLFGIATTDEDGPRDWYDDHEGTGTKRRYANDQYIAHYSPDGEFHFDGCS